MTLTNLFRLHAILALLYAIVLLLAPHFLIHLLSGDVPTDPGISITRLFGAALILLALITWAASRMDDPEIRREIATALFVYTSLGMVITTIGQVDGTWNPLGWTSVVSYLIFVIGYGFFLFFKPEQAD